MGSTAAWSGAGGLLLSRQAAADLHAGPADDPQIAPRGGQRRLEGDRRAAPVRPRARGVKTPSRGVRSYGAAEPALSPFG